MTLWGKCEREHGAVAFMMCHRRVQLAGCTWKSGPVLAGHTELIPTVVTLLLCPYHEI